MRRLMIVIAACMAILLSASCSMLPGGTASNEKPVIPSAEGKAAASDASAAPVESSATESPAATPSPSASPSKTAEVVLSDDQLSRLTDEVLLPLFVAAMYDADSKYDTAEFNEGHVEVTLNKLVQNSGWWYIINGLIGPSYGTNQPFMLKNYDIDGITYGWYIDVDDVRAYTQNAFGLDYMDNPGEYLSADGQDVLIQDSDGYMGVSGNEKPLIVTDADGETTITIKIELAVIDDIPYEEWQMVAKVEAAPDSPYGIHVISITADRTAQRMESQYEEETYYAAPSGFDADGFVFADSSTRYLTPDELAGLSKELLGFARNEIFARHGNIFRKDKYINHYSQYAWYNNIPNKRYDVSTNEMNAIERANIDLIKQFEG